MPSPEVELLWWEGCPSTPEALSQLREVMSEFGLDPEAVVIREVKSDEQARRERFPGSPTIRIEGADVRPPGEGEPQGLTCRVYRTKRGFYSPIPDPDDVREALREAIERS